MRISRLTRLRAAAIPLLMSVGGCYSYRPATPAALVPDAEVRVTLTPEETVRQQQTLGVLKQRIEGRVVAGVGADMLGLVVPQPGQNPGSTASLNSLVALPMTSIVLVEDKRFSVAKTGLLAVAGAAVAFAVFTIADTALGSGGEDPPVDARVAVPFRLIFR